MARPRKQGLDYFLMDVNFFQVKKSISSKINMGQMESLFMYTCSAIFLKTVTIYNLMLISFAIFFLI